MCLTDPVATMNPDVKLDQIQNKDMDLEMINLMEVIFMNWAWAGLPLLFLQLILIESFRMCQVRPTLFNVLTH